MAEVTWRPMDRPVPKTRTCEPDPVGILEIAERLGVKDRSVHMMRRRGVLPEPDYGNVNGARAWEWRTVLWWAGEAGRLYSDGLVDQYEAMFGDNPPIADRTRVPKNVTKLRDDTPDVPAVPSRPKAKTKAKVKA